MVILQHNKTRKTQLQFIHLYDSVHTKARSWEGHGEAFLVRHQDGVVEARLVEVGQRQLLP